MTIGSDLEVMDLAEEFTAKFKVDISDLKKNISEAGQQIKLANAEFAANTAGMDKWSDNAEGLAAKLKQLKTTLESQKSILASYNESLSRNQRAYEENGRRAEELKKKLQELANNGVSKTDEQYKKYEAQLKAVIREQESNGKSVNDLKLKVLEQEAAVGKTEKEIRQYTEAEQNLGKESKDTSKDVEELSKDTKDAGTAAEKGSKGFTVFKGVLADLSATAIKATLNGMKQLAKGFVNLTKEAITGYGEIEQLRGAVEQVFGNDAQKVIDSANLAFQNAGRNANEYLQSIVGFSDLLVSSLGGNTEEAARLATQAMQDMSDNADTFHSDLSEIESAYEGFARGRYTNLVKLNLGYGSTREEMERLITDAEALDDTFQAERDSTGKLTMSFADIVKAIGTVQASMKITGATAKQSADTVEGSIAATQAAWKNLINALGDPSANVKEIAGGLVTAVRNVIKNVAPIVKQVISVFPDLVDMLFEALEEQGIFDEILNLANDLISLLLRKLPSMLSKVAQKIVSLIPSLISTLSEILPELIQGAVSLITALVSHLSEIIKPLLDALPDAIRAILGALPDIIRSLMTELPKIIDALLEALPDIIEAIIDSLPDIIEAIIEELPTMASEIGKGIIKNFPEIIAAVGKGLADLGIELWNWCQDIAPKVGAWLGETFGAIGDWLGNAWELGKQWLSDLWDGISSKATWLWNQITGFLGDAWNKVLDFFGIDHGEYNKHFGSSGRVHGGGGLDDIGDATGEVRNLSSLSALDYSNAPLGRGSITFNQTINSPKTVSRQDVYRNTQALLDFVEARGGAS